MRSNFFNEKYAQPGDDYDTIAAAFEERYDVPMKIVCADLEPEADETFLFGGEIIDEAHNTMGFDGFETLEAARAFLTDLIGVDPDDIQEL